MITIVLKFTIQEDKIEQYREIATKVVPIARKDKGCISYQLFQDTDKHNIFSLIEVWENREAFNDHMNAPDPEGIIQKISSTFEKDPEIHFYRLLEQ